MEYDDGTEEFPCGVYHRAEGQRLDPTICVPYSSIGDQDINFQYIVAYPLGDEEEGLKSIVEKLTKESDGDHVQGLIVMTTTNSATLHDSFWDIEDCDFVVYVVNQAVGKRLMELLTMWDLGEVSVFTQKVTSVDPVPEVESQAPLSDLRTGSICQSCL